MTLEELARELRKLFEFKYLAISLRRGLSLWSGRAPIYMVEGRFWSSDFIKTSLVGSLDGDCLISNLDLSEYKDADGNIDYSKCIVEVE